MKRLAPNLQRVLAALVMCAAFLVMASIFVPLHSGANEPWYPPVEPGSPNPHSVDPHEGLPSLGSFEHHQYYIRAFATDGGPRFTIYDAEDGTEIAALLSAERVTELFPEIPLSGTDFSAPVQIMLADPDRIWSPSGR